MNADAAAHQAVIDVGRGEGGRARIALAGRWTLVALTAEPSSISAVDRRLRELALSPADWDLDGVDRLDSVGALLIWRAWGRRWPESVRLSPAHRAVLERASAVPPPTDAPRPPPFLGLERFGRLVIAGGKNLIDMVALIGQLALDFGTLIRHPGEIPWREFSANLFRSGAQALPVTAMVGFLIGIVLSFLSALQLKTFGADIFIVNLLGVAIIRELGPVIVAVLVAGRSGSAMTAQIGVMRVTGEIDALATMGVSRSLRLVLPKVAALSLAMPLLVVWCSAAGLFGGMVSANLEMGLSYAFFIDALRRVVPLANLWIGLAKGVVFGFLIALIACHFGLKVRPNTESLSAKTTTAVVTAISVVILVDAVIALLTRGIGMPGGF